eukprot:s2111_g9.t1
MCSLLGLNRKLQGKKSPGHADMDQIESTGELSLQIAKIFRTCIDVLLYLASDLPRCQHSVRHLATYSTQPTAKSLTVLKHLASYLSGHEDRNVGVIHNYPNAEPGETIMEIYTDSDWASDKQTRRSISCSTIFVGGCLLFAASRTQKLVSLSSAEAEMYACSSGASDGLLLARLVSRMTRFKTTIYLFTDSSGTRGILQRQGVGRVRHLSCRILWLQDLICNGVIKLCAIAGAMNPADIGTKRLPANRMRSFMGLLGMYSVATGAIE